MQTPLVLVIAGHDPCGGAGIQADIEAIISQGCRAATAITALTVQDSTDVYQVQSIEPSITIAQAVAVLQDMTVSVIKLGLLARVDTIMAVKQLLLQYPEIPVVLDPVLATDGGTSLSQGNIAQCLYQNLLPLTTLVTPNTLELKALVPQEQEVQSSIQWLWQQGCHHVLVTGTHDVTDEVVNQLFSQQQPPLVSKWPRLPHRYHGSGCTLAASISGLIAKGLTIPDAVLQAQSYTWQSLQHASCPGKGQFLPNRTYWRRQ